MRALFISESKLEERRKNLAARLRSCMPEAPFFMADFQQQGMYKKVIGIHGGQSRGLPYRSWRVSLSKHQVSLAYYEVWELRKEKSRGITYLLEKAYLHLYLPYPSGGEKDLIFVQCDPQESEDSTHYRFKIAPHAHFEIAGDPWKNAHVPLCDGWQDEVLENISALDKALTRAMEFLVEQIYPITSKIDLRTYL
jgi:hypothetical protein